ncbi:MAG: hypothetical protein HY874_04070 [Chloroflexi bacterium]|nr:hypothetical protein [Chloroflexota bacterium]
MSPPPRRERPAHRPASRRTPVRFPTNAILLVALAAAIITAVVVRDHVDSATAGRFGSSNFVTTLGDDSWPVGPQAELPRDYRTPFPPFNDGDGPCHDPQFTLVLTLPTEHVYHTGETMSANVLYDAPGCKTMSGSFWVRHEPGSPRYGFYCPSETPAASFAPPLADCTDGFGGSIGSNVLDLTSSSGVVTLTAQPGTFPPAELASIPDLEGARVCALVVEVSDGIPDGSSSFQQINVACPEEFD